MKGFIAISRIPFLIFFFYFANVQISFGHELNLPRPTGPFGIGTKAIEVRDISRTMFRGAELRHWMIQAFYPTEVQKDRHPYMPETLEDGVVQDTKVFAWAKLNADPIESKKFPLVIFIPGLGEERQKYTILCEELASYGYIVLVLDEPYISNFVKFPNEAKVVLTLSDVWNLPKDRDYRYQYYDDAMDVAIKDVAYLLNHLKEIDSKEIGGIWDQEIILMGHSFGGNVAHTLGFQDDRINAVVDIDSKITERKIFGRIGVPPNPSKKPILFIRGMMQYQEEGVLDELAKINNSTIWAPNVEHSAFSDQAYFAGKIQDFGKQTFLINFLNWFFKRGPHWSRIDTNLGDKNVDDWFAEYRKYMIDWLNSQINRN